jgi:beta-galactosidase
MTVRYRFASGCGVVLECQGTKRAVKTFLPRLGFVFACPEGFEHLRYFAKGPIESYEDKQNASRFGEYTTTVTEHFEHYVYPQENMAHVGTRWVEVATAAGHGLLATGADGLPSFSFNCSHFTDAQLADAKHDYELTPLKETVVHLDWRQSGVGSHSCGPALAEEYQVNPREFAFSLRLLPVFVNDVDPYAEMDR